MSMPGRLPAMVPGTPRLVSAAGRVPSTATAALLRPTGSTSWWSGPTPALRSRWAITASGAPLSTNKRRL